MGRRCTICPHPSRPDADDALVRGESYRSVAKRFALSEPAVFRHREHLPEGLAKARDLAEIPEPTFTRDVGDFKPIALEAIE